MLKHTHTHTKEYVIGTEKSTERACSMAKAGKKSKKARERKRERERERKEGGKGRELNCNSKHLKKILEST